MSTTDERESTMIGIHTQFWPRDGDDDPLAAMLEAVPDECNRSLVCLHTYVDGRGSLTTYRFSREEAINLARDLLNAVNEC